LPHKKEMLPIWQTVRSRTKRHIGSILYAERKWGDAKRKAYGMPKPEQKWDYGGNLVRGDEYDPALTQRSDPPAGETTSAADLYIFQR